MTTTSGRDLPRNIVRARDNYTCQDCGIKRTLLDVYEQNSKCTNLKGRIKSLDVHHLNGLCGKLTRKCDSVKDISGMVTLCHKCHFARPEHKNHFNRKIDIKRWQTIKKMRTQRYTFREIAQKFKVSGTRIQQILKQMPNNRT